MIAAAHYSPFHQHKRYGFKSHYNHVCCSDGNVYQNIFAVQISNPNIRELFRCRTIRSLKMCRIQCTRKANELIWGGVSIHHQKRKRVRRFFRLLEGNPQPKVPEVSPLDTKVNPPPQPPVIQQESRPEINPTLPQPPVIQQEPKPEINPKVEKLPEQAQPLKPVEQTPVENKVVAEPPVKPVPTPEQANPTNPLPIPPKEPESPKATEPVTNVNLLAKSQKHHRRRAKDLYPEKTVDLTNIPLPENLPAVPVAPVAPEPKNPAPVEKPSPDKLIEKLIRLVIIPQMIKRGSLNQESNLSETSEKPKESQQLESKVKDELTKLFHELDKQHQANLPQPSVNQQEVSAANEVPKPVEQPPINPNPIDQTNQAIQKETVKRSGHSKAKKVYESIQPAQHA